LLGLQWKDLNGATLRVERQIANDWSEDAVFEPTKTRRGRSLDLSSHTVKLLLAHKGKQAELRLKNAKVYKNNHLMFAREYDSPERRSA
jgi:hypothetical protein